MAAKQTQEKIYIYSAPRPLIDRNSRFFKLGLKFGLLAIILALAISLRLYNLTRLSLWQDEAYDLSIVHDLSFFQVLTYSRPESHIHPPFFYVILDRWIAFLGESEFAVRIFSVVISFLTFLVYFFLVRHILNTKLAIVSLLLVTVSPLLINTSQSSRVYAFLTLLILVSMGLAYFVSEKPDQIWRWAIYSLSIILLIYTNYGSVHIIFAQMLFFLLIFKEYKINLIRLGFTLLFVFISFLPWLGNFLAQSERGPTFYLINTGPLQLVDTLEVFSSWYIPQELLYLVGGIFLPLYFFGLSWLWKTQQKAAIFLGLWSILPVLTSWTSSLLKPNFLSRYFVYCIPAFLVVIAAGLWSIYNKTPNYRYLAGFLLSGILLLNIASYINYNTTYQNQDWKGITNYIVQNSKQGDLILFANPYGYLTPAFDYYYVTILGSPGNLERHSVPVDWSVLPVKQTTDKSVKEMVVDMFNSHQRVWLIRKHDNTGPWWLENVINNIPGEFKAVYYKELNSTEQGLLAFALYVRN